MKILQFNQMNKRYLQVGIPVVVAAVLVAILLWTIGDITPARALPISERAPTTLTNGNVITIGVAADLSGPAESLGWRQANAVQLAVNQINAGGGVDIGGTNYTVALLSADSGCNQIQAITATNTLLNAGVVAVVGHTCTSTSNAAQPLYAAAGVSMITPSATGPQLTEQGYTTTFRVISRDDSPPAMLATHLRSQLSHERAAIVEMDGYFGNDLNDVFSDTFTSLGGTITSRRAVTSTADFTDTLTIVMAENPHTIHFVNDDGNTAGLLSNVAHNLGMTNVVIAWTTYSNNRAPLDDYATAAGIAAEGDIAAMASRTTNDMPGYAALNTDYVAAGFANYGDEAQTGGAFAYDAAQIIVAAIDRAESVNPTDIRDEIAATTNYQGVVGTYEGFDTKGDVIPQWAWLERYHNGQWGLIGPNEIFLPILFKNLGQ